MDFAADNWRLRVRKRLKDDKLQYRYLADKMGIGYTTFQSHLSDDDNRKDSLWFIRELCRVTHYRMLWVLFGIDDDEQYQQTAPWLNRLGVPQWLKNKRTIDLKNILSWFNCPRVINKVSDRLFVWQVVSDELDECGWPAGSWLYVDPDREVIKRESRGLSPYRTKGAPLCLVRLKDNDGLMVCRLETVADKIWALPGNRFYPVHPVDDVEVIGQVVAGLRLQPEIL